MVQIQCDELRQVMARILGTRGMAPEAALACATLFADATRDGVATHGINRFPVLVDMSMSQFSYGKLQEYRLGRRRLPVPGGYDAAGRLTDDPEAIEATRRVLPIGYWKGAALSTILDMIAAVLSGGNAVPDITTRFPRETLVSQVFLAFALDRIHPDGAWAGTVERIKDFIHQSVPAEAGAEPRVPGARIAALRAAHDRDGIRIDDRIWAQTMGLLQGQMPR